MTAATPGFSSSSMFGIGWSAPFGREVRRKTLAVPVPMWIIFVKGREARNPKAISRWVHQSALCTERISESGIPPKRAGARELLMKEIGAIAGWVAAMRAVSIRNPVTPMAPMSRSCSVSSFSFVSPGGRKTIRRTSAPATPRSSTAPNDSAKSLKTM